MSNVEMNNIDVECKRCRVNKYCGTLITCEQTKEVYQQGRAEVLDEVIKTLAESEDTILSDKQFYTLMELKEKKNEL